MDDTQTAPLSELVSEQTKGILLHWEAYDGQEATGNENYYQFVPKSHIDNFNGKGVESGIMTTSGGGYAAFKYVYVYDGEIRGNDQNSENEYTASFGMKMTPRKWVLTEVIGI